MVHLHNLLNVLIDPDGPNVGQRSSETVRTVRVPIDGHMKPIVTNQNVQPEDFPWRVWRVMFYNKCQHIVRFHLPGLTGFGAVSSFKLSSLSSGPHEPPTLELRIMISSWNRIEKWKIFSASSDLPDKKFMFTLWIYREIILIYNFELFKSSSYRSASSMGLAPMTNTCPTSTGHERFPRN